MYFTYFLFFHYASLKTYKWHSGAWSSEQNVSTLKIQNEGLGNNRHSDSQMLSEINKVHEKVEDLTSDKT